MLELLWISLGVLCLLLGFAGSILPVLPGPPIAYLALICVSLARGWDAYSPFELIGSAVIVSIVTALDFVIPVWGAKKYGASRAGVWCSFLGLLIGFFFFPPFGMIVGTFIGAFAGELMAGKRDITALKSAWGTFVGTMLGTVLKIAVCGGLTWLFIDRL